jgi:diaminopropionate ammonia-lyase
MTVEDADAIAVMNRLARPAGNDPAIVAGESGGAGLAGLVRAASTPEVRTKLGLDAICVRFSSGHQESRYDSSLG